MRCLEFFDGLFSVCTEDAVLGDAECPLNRSIIQPRRIATCRFFQVAGTEYLSRPVGRILSLSVALFIGVELYAMVGAPFLLTAAGLFVGTFLAVELGNMVISKTALARIV